MALRRATAVASRVSAATRPERLDFWRFSGRENAAVTRHKIQDKHCRHQRVLPLSADHAPSIAPDSFVAPSATVVGNVEVWPKASVWYNCVVKGDVNLVRIGAYSNIQDDSVVEEALQPLGPDHDGSTIIGHYVTVGHKCILRACTIEDECLVGMGSILEEGAYMETQSMLGAGSVLKKGARVKSGELWAGNPAEKKRDLKPEEKEALKKGAEGYRIVAAEHDDVFFLPQHGHLDAEEQGIELGWKERPGQ